jgi:type IV pilus assembly protein PilE
MVKYKQGFSLVEVMMAVALVSILAAVAYPSYQQYLRDTEFNNCANYILASRLTATSLIITNNSSTAGINAAALGLTVGNECASLIAVPSASDEVLTISGDAGGKTFLMERSNISSGGTWACSTDGSPLGSCIDLR